MSTQHKETLEAAAAWFDRRKSYTFTVDMITDALRAMIKPESPPAEPMDAETWAELHRLRHEFKGPDGFATWKDAAIDERVKRVQAECALATLSAAGFESVDSLLAAYKREEQDAAQVQTYYEVRSRTSMKSEILSKTSTLNDAQEALSTWRDNFATPDLYIAKMTRKIIAAAPLLEVKL
jgi:hypothetical protein